MDAQKLEAFRSALQTMAEQLDSGYPQNATFDQILSGIKEFRKEAMKPIEVHFKKGHKPLLEELDALLNPMFNSETDAAEALKKLARDECHCFLLEKSYQISNASGWLKYNPPLSDAIADYFRLQIFADHLETLNQRLAHILKNYHNKTVTGPYGGYKCMKETYPLVSVNGLNIVETVPIIRNAINHGASVCSREGIRYLKFGSCKVYTARWEDIKAKMDLIPQYSILLATEIDYRLFKYAKGKRELKSAFGKLFNLYKEAFFLGQNLS